MSAGKLAISMSRAEWDGLTPTPQNCVGMNHHTGSSFDSFLIEDGILEEVEAVAISRALAWLAAQRPTDHTAVILEQQRRTIEESWEGSRARAAPGFVSQSK